MSRVLALMRRPLLMAVLALALLLAAGAHASSTQRVYLASKCGEPSYRPSSVILACADANLYVTRLHYSHYGSKTASATGVFHENDCTPYCAAGHFHTYAGSVVFGDILRCRGRLVYTRAQYRFKGPYGSGVADVEPLGVRCRALKSQPRG